MTEDEEFKKKKKRKSEREKKAGISQILNERSFEMQSFILEKRPIEEISSLIKIKYNQNRTLEFQVIVQIIELSAELAVDVFINFTIDNRKGF